MKSPHETEQSVVGRSEPARGPEATSTGMESRLVCYLAVLWRLSPIYSVLTDAAGLANARRSGFDDHLIRLPLEYRGYTGATGRALYYAAAAHVGAHMIHGGPRFSPGELKPVQVALISLLEDARVETLALRQYPGLHRLWLPFHTAVSGDSPTAPALMARLARALIDPDYQDPHAWVQKGRSMFQEAAGGGNDPAASRTIGGLLGNDLGQMRVQFNFRTYTVEPVYRDDNQGLWDFPASDTDAKSLQISIPRTARMRESGARPPQPPPDGDQPFDPDSPAGKLEPEQQVFGHPVAIYSEWDYLIRQERPAWATLMEGVPPRGNAADINRIAERDRPLVQRLTAVIRAAKTDRPSLLRRQAEGDYLDLDAAIRAAIHRRVGVMPEPRVYARYVQRSRSLSSLLLLDVSESTNQRIPDSEQRVFDFQRRAVTLFAHSLGQSGDAFAIRAFCSNGRHEVRYLCIKDFESSYDDGAKARLAGIRAGLSTRIGAALRHAGNELAQRNSHRRLLLVVSDGEPSDIDVADRRYLIEDARQAVTSVTHQGIHVVCVSMNPENSDGLAAIFGRRNVVYTRNLTNLPLELSLVYALLAS